MFPRDLLVNKASSIKSMTSYESVSNDRVRFAMTLPALRKENTKYNYLFHYVLLENFFFLLYLFKS